jgi:hypothetical protein
MMVKLKVFITKTGNDNHLEIPKDMISWTQIVYGDKPKKQKRCRWLMCWKICATEH